MLWQHQMANSLTLLPIPILDLKKDEYMRMESKQSNYPSAAVISKDGFDLFYLDDLSSSSSLLS